MKSGIRRAVVVMLLFLGMATPLSAHPLGNFTINHLTKLTVSGSRVGVHYVLDMAEIPTYQAMREATPHGKMDRRQLAQWAQTEAAAILAQMHIVAGAIPQRLRLDRARAKTRSGAGGLPTLYLVIDAHAVLPAAAMVQRSIAYRDESFPDRLGWRDVVVAPASEPTRELSMYPSASISSPRATTAVTLDQAEGRARSVADRAVPAFETSTHSAAIVSQMRSNQLSDMLARGTRDWTVVLLTLLVAGALGALHALEPGHGKALLAVSLIGARATIKQAALLAAGLTIAHTAGVLALGIAISVCKGYFVPEVIYPWITLASGVIIAIIGARAVQRQLRAHQRHEHIRDYAHGHDHAHGHVSGHAHAQADGAHAHSHAIPGNAPLTFGATVWAAMSGGVAPCPAALVVLFAAIALDQVAYGICVIIAFSAGLAATLTGLGIAVVRGASWLQGRPQFERFIAVGPVVSAIVIATIGATMVGQGFAQSGAAIAPLSVSAIVAIAIAGYAISDPFAHRHVGTA